MAHRAYKSATSHRREIDDHMAARAYAAELEARANGKWTKAIDNVSNAMYALNTAVNAGATAYKYVLPFSLPPALGLTSVQCVPVGQGPEAGTRVSRRPSLSSLRCYDVC